MSRLVVSLAVMLSFAWPAGAQDPVKIDPSHHKVELENEYVRVLRITFGQGEKAPLHQHPGGVAVFLTDHQATVIPEGGAPDPTPRKRGGVLAAAATRHTVENPGPGRSEVILVELKAPPAARTLAQDAAKLDPKHYTVELENDRVRVLRIRYGPGEKSVLHGHWPGVAIPLVDGTMRFADKAGKTMDQSLPANSVIWETGDPHLPENLGDKPVEVVLVELKPKTR